MSPMRRPAIRINGTTHGAVRSAEARTKGTATGRTRRNTNEKDPGEDGN